MLARSLIAAAARTRGPTAGARRGGLRNCIAIAPELPGTWTAETSSRRSIHSGLEHNLKIDINRVAKIDRKTKIVATVGPSSAPIIPDLLKAGMNVMRLNCSHGSHDFYDKARKILQKAVSDNRMAGCDFTDGALEDVCAVALDTKGPEIRTGAIGEADGGVLSSVQVKLGSEVELSTSDSCASDCNAERIYVDYPGLPSLMKPGDTVYIDDGLIALRVQDVPNPDTVRCIVENEGALGSRKGVNLPGIAVDLPPVSEKDEADLAYARDRGVDFVFASFIRNADGVRAVREVVGGEVRVIAKIENQEGIDNFDAILEASDGIMVARGDLGIEIPAERVFLAQKLMVAKANLVGKPVICATQMLESMVKNPRPTRAECVDVANAVLDGADAVMLSSETAKGAYPLESLRFMSKTCKAAEAAVDHEGVFATMTALCSAESSFSEALGSAAVHAAFESGAAMIVTVTTTGTSARHVCKYRPGVPLLAMTPRESTARSLQLHRGVHAMIVPVDATVEYIMDLAKAAGRGMGVAKSGDTIVVLHGAGARPAAGDTTTMRIMQLD